MMMHNDIPLTGLIGSNPLGALAAFGLLRVCSETPRLSNARLYWSMDPGGDPIDDWIAVLRVGDDVDKDELIDLLATRQKNLSLNIFEWSDDIRVKAEDYRDLLAKHAKEATIYNRSFADYFAAFGSEMVTDDSQGLIKPTAFYMTSGQQKFLKIVRDFGESIATGSTQAFKEALFGPWLYQEKLHSLGWDPSTERTYAYRHKNPSKKTKDDFPRAVLGAIWLAVEGIPLFPTAISRGRLETTGFVRTRKSKMFVWPIWKNPISKDALRSLLMTSELVSGGISLESLGRRGVIALYQSTRSEFAKGYAILRPAELVWCL